MKKVKLLFLSFMSLIVLSGCAATVPNVSFNAGMNKGIKKVAIVQPPKVDELAVFYYNHPGLNFGLIGGIAMAAEFGSKESSYNELIQNEELNLSSYFIEKLVFNLKENGYEIELLEGEGERENKLLSEYPKCDADVYLDTVLGTVGYFAGSGSAMYKATSKVQARVVKVSDKSILYDKHISVGENFAIHENVDYLGANEEYFYESFSDLEENAITSIAGLKKALDGIAMHIATSLKK